MNRSVDSAAGPPGAPTEASDVVIVGGGVMGAATACFLARDHGLRVAVLERDPLYRRASSALSASSIRQQFSTPINIALSAWSVDFLRRLEDELSVPGQAPPAIGLVEPGYLYLATEAGAQTLADNHTLQRQAGAEVALLSAAQLQQRFAWLNVEGVVTGSLGLRGEGWFDGPALHQAFRRKAVACGVRFVAAEAVGFETASGHRSTDHATVQTVVGRDGRRFAAGAVVLTAGAWSGPLAARLGVSLPVSARKRDVFVLDSPAAPLAGCPLVIDPSGVWFRPEGRGFIAGAPPRPLGAGGPGDPDEPPLEAIDHALFDEVIWPALAHRVPAFEALRVRSAWAGYYEMNTFDHNGLAGPLPGWANAYTACGFSGHGMQQAPAVGSALAALIAGGTSTAPSLDELHPRRVSEGRRIVERNII
ncbi:MAG: FAD-binding oxidoreductase [Betaproteobacteria bacterium]